ncbi:MAG: ribonuclease P protein component [Armatimonadetes bacterium]|nr:ribonuclease P protein component [Anaerolineae bacterium]
MSLPTQLRLRRTEDFDRIRKRGRAYRHKLLLMSVLANQAGHNRYGFITGKKLGNAVQRNRVRRRLKASVWLLHPQLRVGYDVLFVAHPAAAAQPYAVLQRILQELTQQAGLWADPLEVES